MTKGKPKYEERSSIFNKKELEEIYSLYYFLVVFHVSTSLFSPREVLEFLRRMQIFVMDRRDQKAWGLGRARALIERKPVKPTEPLKSHRKSYLKFYSSNIMLQTSLGLASVLSLLSTELFK